MKSFLRIFPLIREKFNSIIYLNDYSIRYSELFWLNPKNIEYTLEIGPQLYSSGRIVRSQSIFQKKQKFVDSEIYKICYQRWVEGKSWEDTGAYSRMIKLINKHGVYDNCRSLEDVIDRYKKLDNFFFSLKLGKTRFEHQKAIKKNAFREENGILIHIGPENEFFFGGNGNHRLSVAKILEIPRIPVQLGTVFLPNDLSKIKRKL